MGRIKLGHVARPRVRSLWLDQALEAGGATAQSALQEATDCDVCVVGGGFAGMWTSLRIKEQDPSASVVLLDADLCGSGASGRNAGMVMSLWPKIETLVARYGPETAARIAGESVENITEIGAFAADRGFDAHFDRVGWIMAAASSTQLGAWDSFVELGERLGASPFQQLSHADIWQRTGSDAFVGGVYDPTVATIQPALLAMGLRQALLESGVRIFENSPVRHLAADGMVTTPRGAVRARQGIVLTVGGWTSALGRLGRSVVTVASDIVATEPIAAALDGSGWIGSEAVTTSRMTLRYARRTRDGRLVFGTGGSAVATAGRVRRRFDGADVDRRWYEREIGRYFPSAGTAEVTHTWSGPVDRSADGLPFFGALDSAGPRVVYGAGFSGNGVAPSVTAGRILAALVLDVDDKWSRHPLVRPHGGLLPIEPFRSVGGVLVRQAMHRLEDREEAGQSTSILVRKLAAQAPSGLVTLKKETSPPA